MSGRGDDPDVTLLRPYLMTSGRTKPVDHTLEIEAQVMTSKLGAASHPNLTFERRDIISLCRKTMSVAEVAAMLKLHIGVARVLVADLAALGYVVIRRPEAELPQDLRMIERVIRGLESLR
ncbi:hypothetical protein JOF56_000384 [Kibdelosporangium banguiense]|uniref:DUF742 domain-containing protein n=1 Tax=Kibdelosporangium banguiense TaxID=1365924 RepID=A0ABS4T6F1_9PSEU|nr:DUF742 domain-containing protein [Kibdelosporangium banguiense]MBP2319999.1 hypothetical protein [Kibdelosporangium banguiense]